MNFKSFNLYIIFLCLFVQLAGAQSTITGTFSQLANQPVRLEGFNGLGTYTIASTTCDNNGNFSLKYSPSDIGMGLIVSKDEKPFILVLSGENIKLQGEALAFAESIKVLEGKENLLFGQYASEQPRREQALSAWNYLEKIYSLDSLFAIQQT